MFCLERHSGVSGWAVDICAVSKVCGHIAMLVRVVIISLQEVALLHGGSGSRMYAGMCMLNPRGTSSSAELWAQYLMSLLCLLQVGVCVQ